MEGLNAFCQSNLPLIFGIYGLAFVVTGVVVALESGRASNLALSRALPFLAAFGLTHGLHEWIEMFQLIGGAGPSAPLYTAIEAISIALLVGSLACLLEFAAQLVGLLEPDRGSAWARVTPVFLAGYAVAVAFYRLFAFSGDEPLFWTVADIVARYLLGVFGAALACAAMFAQRRAFQREGYAQLGGDLLGAALGFAWYAFLMFIVPPAPYFPASVLNTGTFLALTGVPAQFVQAGVVVMLAVFIIRVMRVFEIEYGRRLDELDRARFDTQQEAARELSVLYETTRIFGTTLDLNRLLNEAIARIVMLVDPVRAGAIFLRDPQAGTLVLRAAHWRGDADTADHVAQETIAAQTAVESGEIAYRNIDGGLGVVALPLRSQNGNIGALCLVHAGSFDNLAIMQTLAGQLVIAIDNARLYAQVQDKERLRGQLLERVVTAQEAERKRLARDLHDQTGQTLTALGLGLTSLSNLIEVDPPAALRRLDNLKAMSTSAVTDLRQFIADLRPALLDDLGLAAALREMARQIEVRHGLAVSVQINGARRRLRPEAETVLYRIAQEALNNTVRHAQAAHASLTLDFQTSAVTLTVSDDGVGFAPAALMTATGKRRAWGLLGMQERAQLVNGTLAVQAAPGVGARLTACVPYETIITDDDDNPIADR
ncbi:MAG: GAF domain-containing sensor histidine kinase [Chloroflexi bacterium]|nr:GAF domain-containing sensor histidine kinase [Chloroflexota bacterium]